MVSVLHANIFTNAFALKVSLLMLLAIFILCVLLYLLVRLFDLPSDYDMPKMVVSGSAKRHGSFDVATNIYAMTHAPGALR